MAETSRERVAKREGLRTAWRRGRALLPSFAGPLSFAVAVAVTVVLFWEWASGRLINELWISRPGAIWSSLLELISSGELVRHAPITAQAASIGFLVGAIPAAITGVALGRSQFLSRAMTPFIIGFFTMPRLALAPLFIIWFGIGVNMKIAFTSTVVYFPVFMVMFAGAKEVSPHLIASVKLMGARRWHIFRHIIIPSTLVWFFVGLKQSVPYAILGAVVGELIASNRGMGHLLVRAASFFDTAKLFAVLVVLSIAGYATYEILRTLERRLMRWRRSEDAFIAAIL